MPVLPSPGSVLLSPFCAGGGPCSLACEPGEGYQLLLLFLIHFHTWGCVPVIPSPGSVLLSPFRCGWETFAFFYLQGQISGGCLFSRAVPFSGPSRELSPRIGLP